MTGIAEARIEVLPDAGFLIGDRIERIEGSHGSFQHVYAATGKPTKQVPLAGAPEMARAVEIARGAFLRWRWMRADRRRQCFLRLAGLLRRDAVPMAELCVVESGIPIGVAARAVGHAADAFEYFGGWTDKIGGEVVPTWPVQTLDYTITEPYGVVAIMLPFNVPLMAASITLAPALAAGNCVVTKPSSMAPFAILRLGELALEAGFPPGVLEIMPADAKGGEALVRTPGVDKVLFMGSGRSAKYVLHAAADRLIPVTTELGGKSAHIVFDDVDPKAAADLAIGTGLGNIGGQGCALGTRLLVQSTVYDDFLEAAARAANSLVIGDPIREETQVGPMVDETAVLRILEIVERAAADRQGRLLTGGKRLGGEFAQGYFVEPTLFADVDNDASLATDEIFGPVLAIMPFETEEEAVRMANESSYGLAAYFQTENVRRVHRLAGQLEAGSVFVNHFAGLPISVPFGGTKESGFGRLGGLAAIQDMTQQKNISIAVIEKRD
jgi:acyl-CoA reductase-like NAD-dependent aldehyde dehydrogenase